MTYKVELTDQAEADLRIMYEYIAFEKLAPIAANNILSKLEAEINDLAFMPLKYVAYDKEPWSSRGLRKKVVNNIAIFYIPNKLTQVVTVIRILGCAMETENNLNQTYFE